jgi:Fe2+ transport system protein FeoA
MNIQPTPDPASRGTLTTLDLLAPGHRGTVHAVSCADRALQHRLLALGLVDGTEVEFVRRAPWGDPVGVRARGYQISLRREEARAVVVAVRG